MRSRLPVLVFVSSLAIGVVGCVLITPPLGLIATGAIGAWLSLRLS